MNRNTEPDETDAPTPTDSDATAGADAGGTPRTNAYLAVGLLADATGEGTYHEHDISKAWEHLHEGLQASDAGTETAGRIEYALETLADLEKVAPDERDFLLREALAELAPIAAGLADHARTRTPRQEKPTVPVFYHIPHRAADRAIRRFQHRVEGEEELPEWWGPGHLTDYLYEEISEVPVIYVDGEPLAEYASGRVDSLTTEGWSGDA
jgi:hypothetical protein